VPLTIWLTVNLNLCLGQREYIFHYCFAAAIVFNYSAILVMLLPRLPLCNGAYVCYECRLWPIAYWHLFIFDTPLWHVYIYIRNRGLRTSFSNDFQHVVFADRLSSMGGIKWLDCFLICPQIGQSSIMCNSPWGA